jgi:hypothetical protein
MVVAIWRMPILQIHDREEVGVGVGGDHLRSDERADITMQDLQRLLVPRFY